MRIVVYSSRSYNDFRLCRQRVVICFRHNFIVRLGVNFSYRGRMFFDHLFLVLRRIHWEFSWPTWTFMRVNVSSHVLQILVAWIRLF